MSFYQRLNYWNMQMNPQKYDSRAKKTKKDIKSLIHHPVPTSLLYCKYNTSKLSRGATIIYGHNKSTYVSCPMIVVYLPL